MSKKDGKDNQDTKEFRSVSNPREGQAEREEKRSRRIAWRVVRITAFSAFSLLVLGAAGGGGYVASMLKGLPKVSASTFVNNSSASIVYDKNGKIIGRFKGDGDRIPISSTTQVSPYLVNSFVAAEDKTFFSNIGINPLSMGRAVVQDLLGHRIESGASTITQQTVKLAVFPEQQRTLHRKVQEIALAIDVNHQLTKNEIMTDYMNWVYMGRMGADTVYGVKRASEILFGKEPKDLTLAEASFLAALPNNPSYFSPYQFPQHTLARQHYILQQMLADKLIDQATYQKAYSDNVLKEIHAAPNIGIPAHPYLMLDEIKPRVIQALVKAGVYANANDAESALPTAGLKIYTTIDLTKQDDVEHVLENQALFQGTDKTFADPQGNQTTDLYEAGFTLIDNQTGGIVAVGGGRDYLKDAIDHADIARQPGSSIKPLLDYGPAIDQQILTAGSVLYDAPTHFSLPNGQSYDPKDDENNFLGLISAREALYESRNVPAIDILAQLTPQIGFSYLNNMGMGTKDTTIGGNPTIVADDANHLASAIGGLDNGATVEQMTSAYTTFPNQGVWHQSYMISHIEDETGRTVFQVQPATHQVFSPATAYIITNMLHDVLYHANGTAQIIGYQFPGQYISGKTGTTDSQADGWFVGYTQRYTAGIWMGYNHHEFINLQNYNLKFTLWNDIMKPVLKETPAKQPWPKPSNVVTANISTTSGMLPTALSTAHGSTASELYIDGTQPTQPDDVDVSAKYVVIGGKKYLATTNTPLADVRTGVFIKLPSNLPDEAHKIPGGVTSDTPYLLPTQADPRGGQVLDGGSLPSTSGGSQLAAPQSVVGQMQGTSVQLTWQPVNGADHYEVYRATAQAGPYTDLGQTSSTTYTDNNLPALAAFPSSDNTVYYEVFAQSKNAMSDASAPTPVALSVASSPTGNATGNTDNGTGGATPPGSGDNGSSNATGDMGNSSNTSNSTANETGNTTTNNTKKPTASGNSTPSASVNKWMPGLG